MAPAPAEASSREARRGRRAPRRTQEERSAETRARVIEAATGCVAERGFRGATMTAIAERAGVTWGAMQHQFGDKEAILDAVMEDALVVLEGKIAQVGRSDADPALRVRRFASRVGELLRGRSYQAFLEIQLNRSRSGRDGEDWTRHVAGVLDRTWTQAFGDLGLSRRALDDSKRFGFMVLAGIAVEAMLFPDLDQSRRHLATLQETLLRIFETGGGA